MNRIHGATVFAVCLGITAVAATAQTPAKPPAPTNLATPSKTVGPPKELLPEQVGGAVVYVRDLDAQKAWYETMLGFRVVNAYARDGKVFEYIMTTGNKPNAPFMGLMYSAARPNGNNTNSRVVLPVPNPKALADFFSKQGAYVREAVPGSAYLILDPEGNQVELYKLSTPAPANR